MATTIGTTTVTTGAGSGTAIATTPAATGGTAPYTYQFQRAPSVGGAAGTYANVGTAGTSLTYSDSGLTIGQTYYYRVIATDSGSVSATSAAGSLAIVSPSFGVATNPASVALPQGGAVSLPVTLSPSGGYQGTDALSVTGLPTGVTASFSPTSLTNGNGTSTLTLTAAGNVAPGPYTIQVVGSDGTLSGQAAVALTVTTATSGVTLDTVNNNMLALLSAVSAKLGAPRTY